jgi:hypothetical protein
MIDLTWLCFFGYDYVNPFALCKSLFTSYMFFVIICKAPKAARVHAGKSSRSPGSVPQQLPTSQWDNIIKFLDSLMSRLRGNQVCGMQHCLPLSALCLIMFWSIIYCLYLSKPFAKQFQNIWEHNLLLYILVCSSLYLIHFPENVPVQQLSSRN